MNAERDRMLSHYRLVDKIGAGGMGVVWKAEDTVLKRAVAIKVLPADLALDEQRRRMFVEEARLAASVSHAHIVQVYELGREGDLDFIVMEFIEGQPLNMLLSGQPLPPNQVADWGAQVAEGLARAHRKGLIHRDLKPANILVTPEGEVKIVDFGLATLFSRPDATTGTWTSTRTAVPQGEEPKEVAGTLPYMSPEQVRGEKLDARSDIFSLGTVLYEMTTGQRPFTGGRPTEITQEILKCQPRSVDELVPKAPPELKRIIRKALAARAADRYQDTGDLAVDLRQLARELESGSSFPVKLTRSLSRAPARKILVFGGIGVAAIALLSWIAASRRGSDLEVPSAPTEVAIPPRTAIAVLPFQNLSAKESNAYFAGGLHDELLTQLSKVAALKVISRTSVMGYQGATKPLKTIAGELGVGSMVEGSVQVLGGRLRVNVQLIDAATDDHLWAETYDRTLDDAFAIQSEVAQQIVAAVGTALTSDEQGRLTAAPTANAEAYRLYLQGREYWLRTGYIQQNVETAQQLFERALGLDPGFALAHAALSQVHGRMFWLRYDPTTARTARQREEAMTALRLAPDLPQAHLAMGLAYYWGQRDFARALAEFDIALKGLPNDAFLHSMIGYVQRRLGNWSETLAAFEKVTQLEPRNADHFWDLGGLTYEWMHRYADAVRAYDRALSLAPDLYIARVRRGWAYVEWHGVLDTLRAELGRIPRNTEIGNMNLAGQRAELLLWERNPDSLLQMPEIARSEVFVDQFSFQPAALYAAWAHQLRGDHAAARTEFDSARVFLDATTKKYPDDLRVHVARGMAMAGLGRREEALSEARWLQGLEAYHADALAGPGLATVRAQILAQAGDAEAALDEVERLLTGPSGCSVHMLRLDPHLDPIREHPQFKALLAKYGSRATP